MNCIDNIDLQRYIDSECSAEELVRMEQHLMVCDSCKAVHTQQLEQARLIKFAIQDLSNHTIQIPEFKPKSRFSFHKIENKIIYGLSAACLLLFVLLFVDNKPNMMQEQFIMNSQEYDSNKPVTDQPLIIKFIDPDGNQSEVYLQ